jgi:hypothetical protein
MRILLSADAGAFIAFEFEGFSHAFAGGFTARFTWPISKVADLGLRQTLHVTVLPFHIYDDEPNFGTSTRPEDINKTDATFLPTSCLTLTLFPGSTVEGHASAGVGIMAASTLRILSLVPHFVAAVGFDIGLPRGTPVEAIRLGGEIDAVYAVWGASLLPRATVAWRF